MLAVPANGTAVTTILSLMDPLKTVKGCVDYCCSVVKGESMW
jgi:hypothetical protein